VHSSFLLYFANPFAELIVDFNVPTGFKHGDQ